MTYSTFPIQTQTTSDVDEFVDALDDFLRAGRRARARWRAEGEQLTLAQFRLLEPLVDACEAMTSGEVAATAGISPPTATRMLDVLQRKGLVERHRAADDRRRVFIGVTPAGHEAVRERRRTLRARRAAMFATLGDDDGGTAARVLRRLAAAIEDVT